MATISNNDIKIRYDIDLSKLQQAADVFDKITSEERQLLSELAKLKKQFEAAGISATTAANNTSRGMSDIESATKRVGNAIVTYFSVTKIYEFAKAVINTTVQFESLRRAINFTSGSIEAGAGNMQFLREVSNRLGISLEAAASGFKAISAAAAQAGYSNTQSQKIFENVSKAVSAFGLSSDDAAGVFRALSQIISKGTVQAEELRGQIGDRIPGAFSIAAKAMGVTERELNKLMATGKVTAAEFVIPFTDALGKMSEQTSTLDSMGKGLQRFQNAWQSMMETLGRQVDENVGIGRFVNALTRTLDYLSTATATAMQEQEKAIGEGYNAIMQSEIANYDKIKKERVKAAVQNQIEITKAELDGANARLKSQKKELEDSSPFRLYGRQVMRANIRAIEDEIEKINLRIYTYQGESKALDELINKKETLNKVEVDPKDLKKRYDEELRYNELLKQQRILMGELYGDPLAKIGAEKAFLEEKLRLQRKYNDMLDKDNKLFTEVEVGNTNLERLNAEKDFYKQAEDLRIDNYKKAVQTDEDLRKERLRIMQQGIKDNKEANDRIAANNAEMMRIYMNEQNEKVAIMQKVAEIATTISDAGFSAYSQRLSNELTLLNRRYDKEIELADGNQQKIDEINQQRAAKEKEIKTKQFQADQAAAVARVIFDTASMIAKWSTNPVTAPLAALSIAVQAAQIGAILSQPVPEFAEGTKGKPFKGGKAIVGERGVEKVVTESGKVYFTPPTATLVDLPKGAQVIPNHALTKQEVFWASHYSKGGNAAPSPVVGKLDELGSILRGLPITQVSMDEKGFEKFIRTPRRTTKILNNRFRSDSV